MVLGIISMLSLIAPKEPVYHFKVKLSNFCRLLSALRDTDEAKDRYHASVKLIGACKVAEQASILLCDAL